MGSDERPYDERDINSILEYAKKLKGRSLDQYSKEKGFEDLLEEVLLKYPNKGKGSFGQVVEDFYFRYKPNSVSAPDFEEAGLELKTTPLKRTSKGLASKERLVLNIINYKEEYKKSFEESSFFIKNKRLLLMLYLYEKDQEVAGYVFKVIKLWDLLEINEQDRKIIIEDWNKISKKINEGRAHEISEGDTFFLSACTKGATAETFREQAIKGAPPAKQRAYSFKSKYINYIIHADKDAEPVIKGLSDYITDETFEDTIIRKFKCYYHRRDEELFKEFKIQNNAKSKYYLLAKAMMGVKKKKIEEFEKADVIMKTIRLTRKGGLKESMSFKQIQYDEIINEDWESSVWHDIVTKKFFFVIFQENQDRNYVLKKVMFWNMPVKDIETTKAFWQDTKDKINRDEFYNFIKASNEKICHIRPKAKNKADMAETKFGKRPKLCYWLNSSYIKKIIAG